jgi:hypothetical protein
MNLATVTKQQAATRFNNQDETPLAFAAQRASLTPQADTVSFSSHTQTQPQFGANKWLLTLAAPFLPLLFTNCDRPEPSDEPCPIGVNCGGENYTADQPFITTRNLSGVLSRRMVDNGRLAAGNQYTYEDNNFSDPVLRADITNDLRAAGLGQGFIDTKLSLLDNDNFTQDFCGGDPGIARLFLGSYGLSETSNARKDYLLANGVKARFVGSPDIADILGTNPNIDSDEFYMTNYRSAGLIVVSDQLDGASGQTASPVWNNESVDLQDNGTNNMEQMNLDAVTKLEHLRNWNNPAVRGDGSVFGLEVNDDIAKAGISGVRSNPDGEYHLTRMNSDNEEEQVYVLAPGAKPAKGRGGVLSDANFIDERIMLANDFDPDDPTQRNQTHTDGATSPTVAYYEEVTGEDLPGNTFTFETFGNVFDAAEDYINGNEEFQADTRARYGPLTPANN